jgi:hypothetical protein
MERIPLDPCIARPASPLFLTFNVRNLPVHGRPETKNLEAKEARP